VGAQAAKVFGNDYLGIVSGVLTLLILIFSEIIPKTLGAIYWRGLAGFTAQTLKVLIFMMYPLVILSKGITKIIAGNKKNEVISREEVSAMTQIGADAGIFKENESTMLRNMIRLRDVQAEDVMTPRSVVVMAPESLTVKEWFASEEYKNFSRIPIYHLNRDDITGYVHKNDILVTLADDHDNMRLSELRRDIMHIGINEDLPKLLDKFLQSQEHLALVTDKFGSVAGIVTQEDIIETVVGVEILDEFDSHADMQQFAREQWRKRATQRGLLDTSENQNKD
jgi:CBS domain containing-hemolysin-like protein